MRRRINVRINNQSRRKQLVRAIMMTMTTQFSKLKIIRQKLGNLDYLLGANKEAVIWTKLISSDKHQLKLDYISCVPNIEQIISLIPFLKLFTFIFESYAPLEKLNANYHFVFVLIFPGSFVCYSICDSQSSVKSI